MSSFENIEIPESISASILLGFIVWNLPIKSFTFIAFLVETVSSIKGGFLLRNARYLRVSSSRFVSSTIILELTILFLIESRYLGVIFLQISIEEIAISISLSSFKIDRYIEVDWFLRNNISLISRF